MQGGTRPASCMPLLLLLCVGPVLVLATYSRGSLFPFRFAWSLVLGLEAPLHVFTLPFPCVLPYVAGLSHLRPLYMASSV